MTNEEYLKGMKDADEKWFRETDITFDQLVNDDLYDAYRQARALEIIAETLINISYGIANIEGQLNRR